MPKQIKKCPKHPTYKAKREPRATGCYCGKQYVETYEAARRIEAKILKELSKIDIISTDPVDWFPCDLKPIIKLEAERRALYGDE